MHVFLSIDLPQHTFSHIQGKVGLEVGPEVGVEAARRTGGVYFFLFLPLLISF